MVGDKLLLLEGAARDEYGAPEQTLVARRHARTASTLHMPTCITSTQTSRGIAATPADHAFAALLHIYR